MDKNVYKFFIEDGKERFEYPKDVKNQMNKNAMKSDENEWIKVQNKKKVKRIFRKGFETYPHQK